MKTIVRSLIAAIVMAVLTTANAQALPPKPIEIDPMKPQTVVLGQWVPIPLTLRQVINKKTRPSAFLQVSLEDVNGNRPIVALVQVTQNGTYTPVFQVTTFIPSGWYKVVVADTGSPAIDITQDYVIYVAHIDIFP